MKKGQRSKGTKASKSAVRDLSPRKAGQVKAGRSDIGQKLQFQLNEANNIYNRG
jgi:hypothetical protein